MNLLQIMHVLLESSIEQYATDSGSEFRLPPEAILYSLYMTYSILPPTKSS